MTLTSFYVTVHRHGDPPTRYSDNRRRAAARTSESRLLGATRTRYSERLGSATRNDSDALLGATQSDATAVHPACTPAAHPPGRLHRRAGLYRAVRGQTRPRPGRPRRSHASASAAGAAGGCGWQGDGGEDGLPCGCVRLCSESPFVWPGRTPKNASARRRSVDPLGALRRRTETGSPNAQSPYGDLRRLAVSWETCGLLGDLRSPGRLAVSWLPVAAGRSN